MHDICPTVTPETGLAELTQQQRRCYCVHMFSCNLQSGEEAESKTENANEEEDDDEDDDDSDDDVQVTIGDIKTQTAYE